MTRGLGWRFLDMGRRIERAQQTLRLFRRTLVSRPADTVPLLEAILEVCDSSMTYRSRYRATLQLAPVLDLMLVDDSNPRAVGHQLNSLSEHVALLPVMAGDRRAQHRTRNHDDRPSRRAADRCRSIVRARIRPETATGWKSLLVELEDQLRRLSDELSHHYLTHTGPARQLRIVAAGRLETFAWIAGTER